MYVQRMLGKNPKTVQKRVCHFHEQETLRRLLVRSIIVDIVLDCKDNHNCMMQPNHGRNFVLSLEASKEIEHIGDGEDLDGRRNLVLGKGHNDDRNTT